MNTPFIDPAAASAGSPIVVGALRLHIPVPSEAKTETIDVQASPFTPDGYPAGAPVHQSLHLSLRAGGPSDTIDYEWLVPLPLKPGRYQVRFAARVEETDAVGSVFADVDVPKFLSTPLSLSGVVISTDPAPPAAPKDAFAKIIPVVPNTARTFAKSDHAVAFVRICCGGAASLAPVNVAMTISDSTGTIVIHQSDTLAAASFNSATRAGDDRLALPLDRLTAGNYVMMIEATLGGATDKRAVRIAVK